MKTLFIAMTLIVLPAFLAAQTVQAREVCSRRENNTALVVIDMQKDFITRGGDETRLGNPTKVKEVLAAQEVAIKQAKAHNDAIIFLEYVGYGRTASVLSEAVKDYPQAKFFKKDVDGMLNSDNHYRAQLVNYLQTNNIGTLVIVGANGNGCVWESLMGSLAGNCNVYAYTEAIADFDYKYFIYPFNGLYKDTKTNCADCTFNEISSVDRLDLALSKTQEPITKAFSPQN